MLAARGILDLRTFHVSSMSTNRAVPALIYQNSFRRGPLAALRGASVSFGRKCIKEIRSGILRVWYVCKYGCIRYDKFIGQLDNRVNLCAVCDKGFFRSEKSLGI